MGKSSIRGDSVARLRRRSHPHLPGVVANQRKSSGYHGILQDQPIPITLWNGSGRIKQLSQERMKSCTVDENLKEPRPSCRSLGYKKCPEFRNFGISKKGIRGEGNGEGGHMRAQFSSTPFLCSGANHRAERHPPTLSCHSSSRWRLFSSGACVAAGRHPHRGSFGS